MSQWRCLVCGYIHEGEVPPEICPLCGVDSSNFELYTPKSEGQKFEAQTTLVTERKVESPQVSLVSLEPDREKAVKQALYQISYGLFIITAHSEGIDNGQCANTCFQITSEPAKIAIGINKKNYTHDLIAQSGKFGVSVLHQEGQDYARKFGYRSGRDANKFEGVATHRGETGVLLLDDVIATLEAKVVGELDAGTHTLFLGEVQHAEILQKKDPMTYAYFRATK